MEKEEEKLRKEKEKREKGEKLKREMEGIEKKQLRKLEMEERLGKENEKKKELKSRKEKEKFRTEEKYFRRRIQQDIQNVMNEGNTFVDDILRNINNIKELKRGYLELNAHIENVFGNEYAHKFLQINNEQNKYMILFHFWYKSFKKIDLLKLHLLKKMKGKNV